MNPPPHGLIKLVFHLLIGLNISFPWSILAADVLTID